ncbi:hypothetical protein Daus18300_004283 [Diaporthe australafricana]|uniref:Uncharacterized protein n=1 Tax=Diaporthe australafricana TaxID=127596 RepID=A0ABR3XAM0_9PEZI
MKFSALVSSLFVAFAAAACQDGTYSCVGNTPATCSGGVAVKGAACADNQNCTIINGGAVCKEL